VRPRRGTYPSAAPDRSRPMSSTPARRAARRARVEPSGGSCPLILASISASRRLSGEAAAASARVARSTRGGLVLAQRFVDQVPSLKLPWRPSSPWPATLRSSPGDQRDAAEGAAHHRLSHPGFEVSPSMSCRTPSSSRAGWRQIAIRYLLVATKPSVVRPAPPAPVSACPGSVRVCGLERVGDQNSRRRAETSRPAALLPAANRAPALKPSHFLTGRREVAPWRGSASTRAPGRPARW